MTNKIIFYTIFLQTPKANVKTFSITFSESNVPKDIYDHHDAVVDYLVDTNPNPFETIPEFRIIHWQM
jgi:hypothetical protein